MERSLSSLTFKGSIIEAIAEAKQQKKLFVVYISGEDAESNHLEKATWTDPNVEESLSKYCIFVHVKEGGTDAVNFYAIYPQKSVPCIAAIGYNGVQLWQNEGFVSAEVLASSLEKAWLGLHIQETTATFLTAALSSRKSEPSSSSASNIALPEIGSSSSSTFVPSPSADKYVQSSEARHMDTSEIIEEDSGREHTVEGLEKITELGDQTSSKSLDANVVENIGDKPSTSSTEGARVVSIPVTADLENSGAEDSCPAQERIINQNSVVQEVPEICATEANETLQDEKAEALDGKKADTSDNYMGVDKSGNVLLNIRLPNGVSLQKKFAGTSTLIMVKDYVDENQATGIYSYDLAIPYPRKVFNDQDLSKSLLELDMFNRQALIVVPHQKDTGSDRREYQASSTTNVDSSDGSNDGYFTYVKRMLSYLNPFSYLGGSASYGQESQNDAQHRPNPTIQNNFSGTQRPYRRDPPNQNTSATGRNGSKSRKPASSSRFGSNIHTLKRDEDDDQFNDRNSFWNGNSTQYGGNSDEK